VCSSGNTSLCILSEIEDDQHALLTGLASIVDDISGVYILAVVRITEPIIVSHLITQSPRVKVNGLPYPKIEKILVDLYTDEEKFFVFQGQELVRIYENVFEAYRVSQKTLFRYAERRKVSQKLRAFICKETSIELIQNQDDCR
jgi:hypothetical protein